MSDAAVDTSSEITTKVRLDAARPPFWGPRAATVGAVFGAQRPALPRARCYSHSLRSPPAPGLDY